ncbi:MAG: hypothetical protein KAJ73_02290 [Zetaproteobacteria bacterium]|nr:hypothetical protein [Zetaproteobacteria bacterium]
MNPVKRMPIARTYKFRLIPQIESWTKPISGVIFKFRIIRWLWWRHVRVTTPYVL